MKININVEISEEAYIRLMSGKSVPGQMKKAQGQAGASAGNGLGEGVAGEVQGFPEHL